MNVLSKLREQFQRQPPDVADPNVSELMAWYGAACLRAQVLEVQLRLVLLCQRLGQQPFLSEAESERFVAELAEHTMGRLRQLILDRGALPADLSERVARANARRNALVHHFLDAFASQLFTGAGWSRILGECRESAALFHDVGRSLDPVVEAMCEQLPITEAQFDSLVAELRPPENVICASRPGGRGHE